MVITLQCIVDLYNKPDKDGNQKIRKRNVNYLKQFDTNFILAEQYINNKGIPSKKWCMIRQGEEYFKINKKFEDIQKLIEPTKISGFKLINNK